MDESHYAVTDLVDADFSAWSDIWRSIYPGTPWSEEVFRHGAESNRQAGLVDLRVVVRDRSMPPEAVAVGWIGQSSTEADPTAFYCQVLVRPEHQRRGIGSVLLGWAQSEGRRRGARVLRASVRSSAPQGGEFLAARGFVVRQRGWQAGLDVDPAETGPFPARLADLVAEGLDLVTLAALRQTGAEPVEGLLRLFNETWPDLPSVQQFRPLTMASFRDSILQDPSLLPEAFFIAREGSRPVGWSNATRSPSEPETLIQDYTCVERAHRRRGLATTLKLAVIDFAQRDGYRRIRTFNDSLNTAIWAINQRLGFRIENESAILEGEIPSSSSIHQQPL